MTRKLIEEKKDNINVKALAIKRWKRLSPFYLTVVILLTIYYWVLNQNVPGDFWSYFVYAQNFYWAIKGDVGTRVPASYHFGYLILDFYLFIVWTRVIEYTKNDRLLRIFWCMLVFSIVYRCVIPQITGNAILAYTMPWGKFDAFSVGGILAIRTKGKETVVEDRTYICYCCCFTVYNLCGFYDEGKQCLGGKGYNHVLYVKQLW